LLYCLNDKKPELQQEQIMQGRAEALMFNKYFGNQQDLIKQFNEVRQLNPKLSKPVLHITLSLSPGEQLENDKLIQIAEQCAKEFGIENNQYAAIYHKDTKHQHLHIVANRIGFDRRTVSDSNNYQKMAKFCRKTEIKYELKQVLSPKRFLSKEQRLIPRADARKEQIKQRIKQALITSKDYHEFEQRMKEKGYQIIKGRGIAFTDNKKVYVKGSELNYSLQTIERILEKQRTLQLRKEDQNQLQKNFESEYRKAVGQLSNEKKFYQHNDLKQDLQKTLEQLMKPEENHEQIRHELLPKKREKKKHRYRHL